MKYIKACDCDNQLRYYDDKNLISKRVCYKCGKWWSPLEANTLTVKNTCYYKEAKSGRTLQLYKYTTYPNYSVLTTGVLHNGEICYLSDVQEFVVNIDGTIMYMK